MRNAMRWAGLTAVLLLSGCLESAKPRDLKKAPVSGTVRYKGNPLSTGSVSFLHATGEMATVQVGPDGRYELQAAVGENKILVLSAEPTRPNPDPNGRPSMLPGKSHIPDKYGTFTTSGLTVAVKDEAQTHDIELKD